MIKDFEYFVRLTQPLVDTWGKTSFSKDKLMLLYAKLKLLNARQIQQIVEASLLEFNYAPSLQKIINLASNELAIANENLKQVRMRKLDENPCRKCDNTGWLDAYDNIDQRYVAFQCDCLAGHYKASGDNAVKWQESLRNRFTPYWEIKSKSGGGMTASKFILDSRKKAADTITSELIKKGVIAPNSDSSHGMKAFAKLSFDEKMDLVRSVSGL